MRENVVTRFIKRWPCANEKEKLELLQGLENYNAKLQGRSPRRIVLTKDLPEETIAEYQYDNPDKIFVSKIDPNPMEMINAIFHEGYHAMFDDYFNNKSDIYSLKSIDEKNLKKEKELQDLIYNLCAQNELTTLFSLKYVEERLARKETSLYMLQHILSALEDKLDYAEFSDKFQYPFVSYLNYKLFADNYEDSTIPYSYLLDVVEKREKIKHKDKLRDVSTKKRIISPENAHKLESYFDENLDIFLALSTTEDEAERNKLIGFFRENYLHHNLELPPLPESNSSSPSNN